MLSHRIEAHACGPPWWAASGGAEIVIARMAETSPNLSRHVIKESSRASSIALLERGSDGQSCVSTPDGVGREKVLSCPHPVQSHGIFRAHCPALGRRFRHGLGVKKYGRIRQRFGETSVNQKRADPSLNLEFVDEALNLVRDAEAKGIRLRILGSVAYRLQCPNNLHLFQDTKRALTDVDFGAEKKQNRAIRDFLVARGYVPDEGIYMASEGARHAYLHRDTGLNVDVFADELYFCHRIPFKGRLDLDSPTICTTDLLLEKMQIVEINLKDFKDTIVLMLEHPLSHEQPGPKSIDTDYIVDIMRQDWGFYYTFTTNLKRVPDFLDQFSSLGEEGRRVIRGRIDGLRAAIEAARKTLGWKMRSKIGTRSRWYQDVSEKSQQY